MVARFRGRGSAGWVGHEVTGASGCEGQTIDEEGGRDGNQKGSAAGEATANCKGARKRRTAGG